MKTKARFYGKEEVFFQEDIAFFSDEMSSWDELIALSEERTEMIWRLRDSLEKIEIALSKAESELLVTFQRQMRAELISEIAELRKIESEILEEMENIDAEKLIFENHNANTTLLAIL